TRNRGEPGSMASLLFVAHGRGRGQLVDIREAGAPLSRKETLPRLLVVHLPGVSQAAAMHRLVREEEGEDGRPVARGCVLDFDALPGAVRSTVAAKAGRLSTQVDLSWRELSEAMTDERGQRPEIARLAKTGSLRSTTG